MEKSWLSQSPEETGELAKAILEHCKKSKIFAILGPLGAGKTTLIQALCKVLGSQDEVKSPSFALVHEYARPEGKIFHFDFYRIRDISEAYSMGYEEYFDSDEYCFIEWPEMIEELLPVETNVIKIEVLEEGGRKISMVTLD